MYTSVIFIIFIICIVVQVKKIYNVLIYMSQCNLLDINKKIKDKIMT